MSPRREPTTEATWPEGAWQQIAPRLSQGVAISRDGRLESLTARFAELTGGDPASDLVGRELATLFAGEALPKPGEVARVHPLDAPTHRLSLRAIALPDAVAWLLEEAANDPAETNERLEEARREVQALRRTLDREHARREELFTMISHELRTPVTVIAGYSRLLRAELEGLSEKHQRFLDESARGCRRLDALIAQLLEAAEAKGVDAAPRFAKQDLALTVRETATFMRPLLEPRELSLRLDLHEEPIESCFDTVAIGQVLTNLLANAVRFARTGGEIALSTRSVQSRGPRFIELAIEDDGPGVAPEQRERIFEPWVREPDRMHAGGLGLGLAICRRIVEAHGGSIEAGERAGGGGRFSFVLPIFASVHEAESAAGWSGGEAVPKPRAGRDDDRSEVGEGRGEESGRHG